MNFWNDLRFSFRMLAKNPGFTVLGILVLALGIGANSAMFNIVNTLLFRPILAEEPARLVGVYSRDTERLRDYRGFSYPNYRDLLEMDTGFSSIAAHNPVLLGWQEREVTRRVIADFVSANYFEAFGVQPKLGRVFTESEERPGSDQRPVIMSYKAWQRWGGAEDILGRNLTLNGQAFTVVGVMPEGFTGSSLVAGFELYLPLSTQEVIAADFDGRAPRPLSERGNHELMLMGRLQDGLSLDAANQRLEVAATGLASIDPEINGKQTLLAAPLSRFSISTAPQTDDELGAVSLLLLGMSLIVLLIASLNLANMQAARVSARIQEFAVRRALGGSRAQLLRQLAVEGFILSVAGGLLGLVIAVQGPNLLTSSLNAIAPIDISVPFELDWRVLVATVGFCAVSTLIFSVGPAVKMFRQALVQNLKEQRGHLGGQMSGRTLFSRRNIPVLAQVALSLVLLVSGGLFTRAAYNAIGVDLGFSAEGNLLVEFDAGLVGLEQGPARDLTLAALERVRTLPGVTSASVAATVPFGTVSNGRSVYRAEDALQQREEGVRAGAGFNCVSADYFETLGIPLVLGRGFTRAEESGDPRLIAIVDQKLADRLWPGASPVGRKVAMPNRGGTVLGTGRAAEGARLDDVFEEFEVVGVAANVRTSILDTDDDDARIYVPLSYDRRTLLNLHVAYGSSPTEQMAAQVREVLLGLNAQLPILSMKTMRRHLDESMEMWIMQAGASIFSVFGLIAVAMATLGVYGIRAYSVARRSHEIGIRMALGSSSDGISRMILREGMRLSLIGLAGGVVLALGVSQLLSSFLVEVSPTDPMVFGTAATILLAAALMACYVPARRASRVDPMVALRYE